MNKDKLTLSGAEITTILIALDAFDGESPADAAELHDKLVSHNQKGWSRMQEGQGAEIAAVE